MSNPATLKYGQISVSLLVIAALWACSPGDDKSKVEKKAEAPKAAPEPAKPEPAKKADAKPAAKAPDPGPGWVLLTKQEADYATERERIKVGGKEGKFKELQIMVQGAPVTIEEVVLTFGNNKQFRPKLRPELTQKSSSGIIDLPGDTRTIRDIELVFRTSGAKGAKGGKGTVYVYAR